jgi:hypothetical protein
VGSRIHRRALAVAIATGIVASALLVGGGAASAANPEKVLSHFLCWQGTFPASDGPVIQLNDRFATFDANVDSPDLLCNPVKKTRGDKVTKIVSGRHHLVHYDIGTPFVNGSVRLRMDNQFGDDKRVRIEAWAKGLLVPTRRLPQPDPTNLDHFTCYSVVSGPSVDKKVVLKDEFERIETKVGQLSFACVPTAKVHDSNSFSPQHPRANLACYEIGGRNLKPPQTRDFENQFEAGQVTATRALFLCVPSKLRRAT